MPGGLESASKIAEHVRSSFEAAGAIVASHAIGATISIGAAVSREPVTTIDGLIAWTDAALYRGAKHPVRNRVHIAEEDSANDRTRMIAAVRRARQVGQRAAQSRCLRKSASAAG